MGAVEIILIIAAVIVIVGLGIFAYKKFANKQPASGDVYTDSAAVEVRVDDPNYLDGQKYVQEA